jgi:glycosyltransferase involved in cell wall biosynthesis
VPQSHTAVSELRVLSVVGQLEIGGAQSYLARIAPRMRAHGIEMEICALERVGPMVGELERAGIVVHPTPYASRVTRSNTATLLRTVESIRQIVRRGRFDIVHTYLFWSDVLGVSGAWLARCPRIVVGRRALHAGIHDHTALFHTLEQVTNSLASDVVANSRAVLRDSVAHERFLPRRRYVIYNGVNASLYEPAAGTPSGPLRLITVGALAPLKGQAHAIQAMRLVGDAGVDARLVLVGSGPDEAELRHLANEIGVAERITFAGEQSDPRPFLKAAEIFLLPSLQEGFSNAILEAMATALPVIATDVGGNAEAVIDGVGGLLVPPEKPEALAAAIIEMARRRGELEAMGHLNRDRVVEQFSLDASTRKLADLYLGRGELIDSSRGD